MKKLRKTQAVLHLPTLTLEGSLFLSDQLEKAALGRAPWQTEADYGTPKGLKLKDDYSRAFQIACAQWRHFAAQFERADADAAKLTHDFVRELLRDVLGYTHVQPCSGITLGERHYPISLLAGSVPVVVAPHTLALHEPDPRFAIVGAGSRKKSAFMLAQELLNASPEHLWGIACNGKTLRLLRDAATLTRPSFLEVDLADLLGGQRYAEFANVWRLLHASRAAPLLASAAAGQGTTDPTQCIWEQWRAAGQQEGTRVRDGLRQGVTDALQTLGEGFIQHPANDALRAQLHTGELTKDAYFQQLLRLIYRLIFVFTVEERGLLHPAYDPHDDRTDEGKAFHAARRAYAQGYALARLRDLCLKRRARNRFDDRWQALRIVFQGLSEGEPRLALPALGGLFATSQCPQLDTASLDNAHLLAAMQNLRWASHKDVLAPVDYRNMGPEELGSVYESLLELVPEIDLPARRFGFVGLTSEGSTAGNARKLSGSYYTPDSLVQALIKSALDPVIEQRLAAQPQSPIDALLSIRVIDPACGSGHFLLAAARRLAEKLAQLRAALHSDSSEQTEQDFRHALREVVSRCIFGVDRNPMAVELARTALWLEGFEQGRPLGFLDHHLQVGDALLGLTDLKALELGIAKDAFKPLSGDDKDVCKQLTKVNAAALKNLEKKRNAQAFGQLDVASSQDSGLKPLQALEALPENSTQEISAKEAAYRAFLEQAKTSRLAHAADLLVGAYLLPKREGDEMCIPTSATLYLTLLGDSLPAEQQGALAAAQTACMQARVLHWPLAFPQVFASGGFDCVLGNPPWDMLQLDPQEFFATRDPNVANAKHMAARDKMIAALEQTNPRLHAEYWSEVRLTEAAQNFIHASGRFPTSGFGRLNLAYLFTELFLELRRVEGRSGLIVPTGIATDSFSQHLFNRIANGNLISLFDIENREAVFPSVHRSYKFCLLTLGAAQAAEFVCFASQVSQLADPRRRFTLTPEDFGLLNPNTRTCPVFRSNADAELTKKIYRSTPVLWRESRDGIEERNPWGLQFMLMFMMNTDSYRFKDAGGEDLLPLYEAKMIHQFDHRWATYIADGDSRDMTLAEKQDPTQTVRPRYWVDEREVLARIANVPARLSKAWLLTHTQGAYSTNIPQEKTLEFAVASWLAGGLMREAVHHQGQAARTLDALSKNEFAQALHWTQNVLEQRYPPLAETLRAAGIEGKPAAKAFAAWCEDDRDMPLSQQELDEVEGWMGTWHGLSSEGTRVSHLLLAVDAWMKRRSPAWLMGWRDITNATNERTVIASVVPRVGVGHTMPLFMTTQEPSYVAALLANFGALVLDFCARVKVGGTHLTYGYLKQFPVLPPDCYIEADLAFIVPRVLELTYTAHNLQPWAQDLGYYSEPFAFNPTRRAQLRAELDAYYARLYGLTRDELRYILDPTDIMGEDYPSETFRVLKNKEMREFGEYRTQRLVLQAWDQLETETGE